MNGVQKTFHVSPRLISQRNQNKRQVVLELASPPLSEVKTFPIYEKYDLARQMRRSVRSIPSDISEGFGRVHFNDKLTFYERCRASLDELRNHFQEALGNKYIDEDFYKSFFKKINEIGYLLNRMMKGVRTARDLHGNGRRIKSHSRRSLTSSSG